MNAQERKKQREQEIQAAKNKQDEKIMNYEAKNLEFDIARAFGIPMAKEA